MAKKIPMRQCVGCGQMKNKKEMVRIIKQSDGTVLLDKTGKQNGRGAYICNDKECFKKSRKNKGLERSLKSQIPEEILDQLEKEFDLD
ncbi:MAG: YlxR family protein [Butyrivibrio sp.]|nr:YlxR family protein [Butyrivibrio sp.]